MQTVLITGGTGTIGKTLVPLLLQHKFKVILLTRHPHKYKPSEGVAYAAWDVKQGKIDLEALRKADHIIHMAGAGVADERWTEERKKEIVLSRTESSALLISSLLLVQHKVKTLVSSSAIGWYGPDAKGGAPFTEDAPPSKDFLGATCEAWETAVAPAEVQGIRLIKLRTGIVLSNDGGALVEFKKPLALNTAAILGTGEQMVSWIHVADVAAMYLWALQSQVSGPYNAVAPRPVTNKELTRTLAQKLKGKAVLTLHVPRFALKLAMGEMSVEVLKSCTVSAQKAINAGFTFQFPTLDKALDDLTAAKS